MKIELRKNRDGSQYYSIVYYDTSSRKQRRISKSDIRKRFGSDLIEYNRAVEACKLLEAETSSVASRAQKIIEWENEYYDFASLLDFYTKHQQKKAPNSYKNNIHYLRYYVLPFFLSVKRCNNISQWFDFYPEFKDWLEEEARLIKRPGLKISYSSKNHAIKALNTFMKHIFDRRVVDRFYPCESFPAHTLTEKGLEALISPEEMEEVYAQLIKNGAKLEAVFYRFLFFTGMRFNEALGLHPANIYDGEIEDATLAKHLERENIDYFGYVVINSQPNHSTRGLRDKNGIIHRKPLKGRKKVDDKSARTVVITDKLLWNELVALHNQTLIQVDKRLFGGDISQYPVFEGADKTTSANKLRKAYAKVNLPYRSWHCCRHTRATMLIGETGNTFLARLWLGHSSEKVLNRYVHIYEAVVRSVKKSNQEGVSKIRPLRPAD